ncbi:MAG TPA: cytochrome c [Acidobacteriaceae bacterium]|nr:cytochrome c [Terriglobia bacterium]HVC90870.1 cytochrome c [Acidobacteriaceae bacterium]
MSMHSSNSLFRWTLAAGAVAFLTLISGCRQDMQNEPKMIPQRESRFFANGRSVRPQVLGTVARGQLDADTFFYTGLIDNKEQDAMPFPVTMTVLRRGQERFDIYCTPCHSRVGNGRGMIVERGYKPAGDYHDPTIRNKPISHYFRVMTDGYGAMPDYASQLTPQDRWAVAAYIRALQLSQNATMDDVPAGTNIQTLAEISQQMGYSANFPQDWTTPRLTNVPSEAEMKTAMDAKKKTVSATTENAPRSNSARKGAK